MTRQIVCMKWGTLYGAEYVNRLYAMVRKNITGDIRFVCLTDDTQGIRSDIECLPCPSPMLNPPYHVTGWRKLSLFAPSEQLFGFTGDWLYLDLDVVITDSLDAFFTYAPEQAYIVMQNWTQPGKNIGNTSVYRFRVGCATHLLENVLNDKRYYTEKYNNSQTYISREIGDLLHFWPDAWCQLFKVQCVPPWPMRYWQVPQIPKGCKVVAFPGHPNPDEAMVGKWAEKAHKKSRINYKRLYKYIRPVPWIKTLWEDAEKNLAA